MDQSARTAALETSARARSRCWSPPTSPRAASTFPTSATSSISTCRTMPRTTSTASAAPAAPAARHRHHHRRSGRPQVGRRDREADRPEHSAGRRPAPRQRPTSPKRRGNQATRRTGVDARGPPSQKTKPAPGRLGHPVSKKRVGARAGRRGSRKTRAQRKGGTATARICRPSCCGRWAREGLILSGRRGQAAAGRL